MIELYEFIFEYIKTYRERFLLGLFFVFLCLTALIFFIIFRRIKKRKKNSILVMVLDSQKKKANKIEAENKIKEEIILNYTQKFKEEQKKNSSIPVNQYVSEFSSVQAKSLKINDNKEHNKLELNQIEKPKSIISVKIKEKSTVKLPEVKIEKNKEITENLFVNYQLNLPDNIGNYAVIRIPKKGCVIRSHRFGNTKRRGFKEDSFQKSIQKYFGNQFIVSGDVRLNTGKNTRPFEPDIAIIDRNKEKNIRIDIEIDEPYAGITRQPTHCKGDDSMRDSYFVDRGWLVIRFSEYQVHTQEIECLKYISFIINSIDLNYHIHYDLKSSLNLKIEKLWDIVQSQKWEKTNYREQYLNHQFVEIPDEKETDERDFSKQEINEEKLVKPSIIGIADKSKNIGINKINANYRDKRIVFYPESHIYTIDSIPLTSASTIISKFFPVFDSEYWSRRKAIEKLQSINIELSELNIRKEAKLIEKGWKDKGEQAANEGTFLHEQIENYYLNKSFQRTNEFHLFEQFVNNHANIEPYRTEWRIYNEDYNIAGTIDLIAKNTQGYEIYDWKRSKKIVEANGMPIKENRFQCGVGRLQLIPDTSYNRYCLQQSLYRNILEEKYNLKISKMFLIVLHPDYDKYYKVETPYLKDSIEYILNTL